MLHRWARETIAKAVLRLVYLYLSRQKVQMRDVIDRLEGIRAEGKFVGFHWSYRHEQLFNGMLLLFRSPDLPDRITRVNLDRVKYDYQRRAWYFMA